MNLNQLSLSAALPPSRRFTIGLRVNDGWMDERADRICNVRSIVIRLFGEGFWRLVLDVATIVNVIIFEGVFVSRQDLSSVQIFRDASTTYIYSMVIYSSFVQIVEMLYTRLVNQSFVSWKSLH